MTAPRGASRTGTASPVGRTPSPIALVVLLGTTFLASAIGGLASRGASDFYAQLDRPAWAPPGAVFGPVWTVLYVLMAIAAWLVWRERRVDGARGAFTLYGVQLGLNALWSWLFFAWRRGGLALAEVVVLLVFIALTAAAFWRVRWLAGALLLPYLAWVAYATALTASVWRRNPELL